MKKGFIALALLFLFVCGLLAAPCSGCSEDVDSTYKFCPFCGIRLWVCPKCGIEVQRSFRFCPDCGDKLWGEEQQEEEPVNEIIKARKESRRIVILPCFGEQDLGDWIEDSLLRQVESFLLDNFENIEIVNREEVAKLREKLSLKDRTLAYTPKILEHVGNLTGANVIMFSEIKHFSLENKEDMLGDKSYLIRFNVESTVYDVSERKEVYRNSLRKKYFSLDRITNVIDQAMLKIVQGNFQSFVDECPYPWKT